MANHPVPLNLPALALSAVPVTLVLGSAAVLAWQADTFGLRPADWQAFSFTLKQAALSALVSTVLAIPIARALARRRFPGRGAMVALMGVPFLLPVVVAVVGMLSVYGRNGVANQMLDFLGLPQVSIFGVQGVVLTNVFFNLPLVTRIFLNGWTGIPAERLRLAQTLDLPASAFLRHIELPMLRDLLPGAFALVFLLCMSSFVVSLTFGGGPRATTLELAIYQALRFDFDLGRAAALAGLQFTTCATVVVLAGQFTRTAGFGAGLDRAQAFPPSMGWQRAGDIVLLSATAVFLSLPLLMVVWSGLPGLTDLTISVWQAAVRSVVVAVISTALSTGVALCLALAVARGGMGVRWIQLAAMLPLAASGLVLGTGLFLVVHPVVNPASLALPITIMVNAVIALPFLFRLLLPEARALQSGYDRLCSTLGLQGMARLRFITLPRLARPLGLGAGIAAALSMGDLGVIALFASEDTATLPLMVQRLAGAYRMEQAAAASLVLIVASFALFWACDTGGRRAAP